MKKQLALAVVLGLFLISIANPSPYSMPLARGNESNEKPFFAAADGDESSESITSFSETLADDVLFYPDAFNDGTAVFASSGTAGDDEFETYAKTHQFDDGGVDFYYGTGTPDGWVIINFTVPSGTIEGFDYAHFSKGAYLDDHADYMFYDWAANDWVDFGDAPVTAGNGEWCNGTIWDTDYWGTQVSLKVNSTDADSWGGAYIDYAELTFYNMTLADSDHYAESFADLSEWVEHGFEGDDATSSDGDVLIWLLDDNDNSENYYTNTPSLAAGFRYVEIRTKTNVTGFNVALYSRTGDWGSGSINLIGQLAASTTWITYKFYHAFQIECIYFYMNPAADYEVKVDYLRIGPADEMGFQHDGSTTAGWALAYGSGSISSDGDTINYTGAYDIMFDAGTTDQYSFVEIKIDSGSWPWQCGVWIDGTKYMIQTLCYSAGIFRYNIRSQAAGQITGFRMYSAASPAWIEIDYIKVYSIANFTVTQSGSCTTADKVYVDSSDNLVFDRDTTTWLVLEIDPAPSITIATYTVWNITQSGDYFGMRLRGSPSWNWGTTQTQIERGATADAIDSTDTSIIDLQIHSQFGAGVCVISAIKFIEDSTAPDILDKFVTPIIPDDDESVTLTAVTYDAIEVYEVIINAVVYPAGFSDVDYVLTEQTDNVLWSYEFSTLTAGYYLFQITASDGANTYSEYIPVTIRESAIEISTYTFFGASSDFSYMQYSGYINRDCTYDISEWSDSWAKNETHTGSVSEGMFNIAWDKIGVDDLDANFTIVFVNGSLSLTIEGYYGTAYKELRITEIDVGNLEESQAVTNITINFYTNKDVDWFVYDVDDSDAVLASGSSSEGSDYLTWLKDTTPHAHYFAIKWTDGVSNIWFNSSYWTYKENIDSIDQPGKDWDAIDTRQTIEFWTTLGAFVAIGGLIAIGISHYKLNKKIGNLPNYQTQ